MKVVGRRTKTTRSRSRVGVREDASPRHGGSPAKLMNRPAVPLDLGDNAAVRPPAPAEVPHGDRCRLPDPAVAPRRGAPPGRRRGDDPRHLGGERRPLSRLRRTGGAGPWSVYAYA